MKILISGASGYVGTYLLKEIDNWDVTCLDLLPNKLGAKNIIADIRNVATLNAINTPVDAVIHLAALLGSHDDALNYETNVVGTKNMLDLAQRLGAKHFIYISSVSAKRSNQGPYGRTKKEGETLVENSKLNYTILRPSMIIGRESLGLNRVLKNSYRFPFFVPLVGLGHYTRQPIYVRDFVKLIKSVTGNETLYGKSYDAGGCDTIAFRDLVKLILQIKGNDNKLLIPVPVAAVNIAGKVFERVFSIPPFTSEHVMSLTEDTIMNIEPLQADTSFNPTPLRDCLSTIIGEIQENPPNVL